MHNNPCTGKWKLAGNPIEYFHSSAKFYLTGVPGIYPLTNFMEMEEVNFNLSKELFNEAQRPQLCSKAR